MKNFVVKIIDGSTERKSEPFTLPTEDDFRAFAGWAKGSGHAIEVVSTEEEVR